MIPSSEADPATARNDDQGGRPEMLLPLELTLVLAATRDMGIGLRGGLPWTGLRKEMAYFARVTKRLPPTAQPPALNAVVMGRKTWESIPPRFRPLKGRLNVVVSRSSASTAAADADAGSKPEEGPVMAASLDGALAYLLRRRRQTPGSLGRVFVVGGAQVYGAALGLREQAAEGEGEGEGEGGDDAGKALGLARRILLTRVVSDFECDVFFPLRLAEGEGETQNQTDGWARRSQQELDAWAGEEVPAGLQREDGTEYEFQMWERED